jgi:ABC-type dipeptide/oligopeptide/nickel transport system permease component
VGSFVARRIVQAVPVLVLASIGIFALLHLVPGDPAVMLAGPDATPEIVSAIRHDMGLDAPVPVQYALWLGHVLRGDLGRSYVNRLPVSQLIGSALPATIELGLAALLLAVLFALPTGVIAAVWRQRPPDWLCTVVNGLTLAIPNFWLGILLIIVFGLVLGWLPPGGRVDPFRDLDAALRTLLLPAVTLGLPIGATLSRFTRAAMLEVLHEDYIRTARAKGLPGSRVVLGHGIRNALIPIVTVLGIQFGRLLGGAVIVESVFAWPGVGRLILQSVLNRDYLVVQGALLLLVIAFIVINLLVDLLYGVLDPRIRLAGGAGSGG